MQHLTDKHCRSRELSFTAKFLGSNLIRVATMAQRKR